MEAGGLGIQIHPQLKLKSEASLNHEILCVGRKGGRKEGVLTNYDTYKERRKQLMYHVQSQELLLRETQYLNHKTKKILIHYFKYI